MPFLVIILLGIWEIGRFIQVQQILNNAAREGARLAAQGHIINSSGTATDIQVSTGNPNVEATVRNYLRQAGLDTTGLTVTFVYTSGDTTLTQPSEAAKGQQFRLNVTLPANNVRWTLLGLTNITTLRSQVVWMALVDDPFTINTTLPTW
jgi:Flp pilus assembly protein TadG